MIETLRLFNNIDECLRGIPQIVATEAVNFSKERFVQQNWVDTNTEPWRKRRTRRGSKARSRGAILVSRGRLKRSVRKILVTSDVVVIGSDVPYAQIHNDGFRGRETVKAHKRKKWQNVRVNYKTKSGKNRSKIEKRAIKGSAYEVKSFTRIMNMPRRRFIGQSDVLNKRIERTCTAEIMRAIKSSF